jgi:hypothetical protein
MIMKRGFAAQTQLRVKKRGDNGLIRPSHQLVDINYWHVNRCQENFRKQLIYERA